MSAVVRLPLHKDTSMHKETQPTVREPDAVAALPQRQRQTVHRRTALIEPVLKQEAKGVSRNAAIDWLLAHIESGDVSPAVAEAAEALGRNGKPPTRSTLHNWLKAYTEGGAAALAGNRKGRQRKDYGWELRAQQLYSRPTKPAMHTVAYWLREEGFDSAHDHRVRRYLKSLPERLGAQSPARMGRHFYKQNLGPYVERDESVLPVGFAYQGDGHTCDVYVAHPRTGKAWRPELTVWIDVRSHFVVGWHISEAESAITTLYSLSSALVHHDHTPAMIHVDPGSGFKNKLINDEVAGYLTRMSIEFMAALPGNAKGKGMVERWFGIFEERCGKRFETYCGHCRTDSQLRHLSKKVERGDITLPTYDQYLDGIRAFIDSYNANVQQRLGCAPAELWQQLDRVPVELGRDALVRPRVTRTIRRWGVQLWKRRYQHEALADHKGEVLVEYDLHDDSIVTVRDLKERFICDAHLVDRKDWMPGSRIEDLEQRRLDGQIKRLDDKRVEAQRRSRQSIEHKRERLRELTEDFTPAIEHNDNNDAAEDIDFLSTDY